MNSISIIDDNLSNLETYSITKTDSIPPDNQKQINIMPPEFGAETVVIRIEIFKHRTIKLARGRAHRPHSKTQKSERESTRKELEEMIDQNLRTAKDFEKPKGSFQQEQKAIKRGRSRPVERKS